MGSLGKSSGVFSLSESDSNVGSFFSADDLYTILKINKISISEFRDVLKSLGLVSKNGLIDESRLYKKFDYLTANYSTPVSKKRISFDEYVICSLIERALPEAIVERQVVIPGIGGNSPVDFHILHNEQEIYLEFDGPSHFAQTGQYQVRDSRGKKKKVEDITGVECVCWPFWIQRCERDVKALFDSSVNGLGALWSSKALFGNFCIERPSELILSETERFNAIKEEGVGYFYGTHDFGRNMPTHPIIADILEKKAPVKVLIPSDVNTDYEFWLPSELWHLI